MNTPQENPYASPQVDEFVEVLPDSEEGTNKEFEMRIGKIVGESPLSLPKVCLYCASDIEDDYSLRRCAKYQRLRLLEALPPVSFQLYYSTCSRCLAKAADWRRGRRKALFFIAVASAIGATGFIAMIALNAGREVAPQDPWLYVCFTSGIAVIGGFFRVLYCESQLPKFPELNSYDEDTFAVSGAGWKFIQRYR